MTQSSRPLDTQVAHIARVYDYWLGGKDNFAIDRQVADMMKQDAPDVVEGVLGNRAFLARAVHHLATEFGMRQFLDIGTGLPAANNTHEVAQSVAPDSRVVYVDNDPIVLSHARALLTGAGSGATDYLDADLRDTPKILRDATATLDFGQPLVVMLVAVLHCIPDEDDPAGIVRQLMQPLAPGSFLVLSHPAIDIHGGVRKAAPRMNQLMHTRLTFRNHDQVVGFFDGLDLLEPGVVRVPDWRPVTDADRANPAAVWGGVGRKA